MHEVEDEPLFAERVAGIDIAKAGIEVTIRVPSDTRRGGRQQETRSFRTADGLSGDCPRRRQPTAALIPPLPLVVAAFVLLVADAFAMARPGQCPISTTLRPG